MAKTGKVTFKDTVAEFGRINADIAARKFASVYLLMGEEGYFVDALADRLAGSILGEAERAFSQIVLYGKESDAGVIVNHCRQIPMMGSHQVVILREAQQLRKIEQLSHYTRSPQQTTILVICHKEKNLDKRGTLYKQIATCGEVFESVAPRDYEIGPWLESFIRRKGCAIEPKALTMLTEHLGADIGKISNELDKLFIYLPEGTKTITATHIEENIGISKDFNNFELTRALSERNMEKALRIADHFACNPKENPLVVTLGVIFSHFQRIFILNYQRWLVQRRGNAMPPDIELSRLLKLPNPFFLNEYKQAAAHYPNKKVFTILGLLREYDLKSKGMNAGSADDGELLRELLLKIFFL